MKAFSLISLTLFALFFNSVSEAEVSAQFHPYDSTFQTIAHHIGLAQKSIDIAMYNMDGSDQNPIIKKLGSPEVQNRVRSKTLKIRMIFEGTRGSSKQAEKLHTFQELGIEVRFLNSGREMHHKFAVFDIETKTPTLISGSANWSLFSYENYNENILFFEDEDEIALAFHQQFEFLWGLSKIEESLGLHTHSPYIKQSEPTGIRSFFNTENFKIKNGKLVTDPDKKGFYLTNAVTDQIDLAKKSLKIATTRIKLRPIYDALVRAAERGVKIEIVVTMDEYETKSYRQKKKVPVCKNPFDKKCSSGNNFSVFLQRNDFEGHNNINLRIKFFDLDQRAHLAKQMHSKYMIIDDQRLLTGSFNWSYSAEYGHIENLILIDGRFHPEVINAFNRDFRLVYGLNRGTYMSLIVRFEEALRASKRIDCSFDPVSLTFSEIDYLLDTDERFNKSFEKICI